MKTSPNSKRTPPPHRPPPGQNFSNRVSMDLLSSPLRKPHSSRSYMNLAMTNPTTSLKAFQSQEPDKLRPTLITTLWQASQQLCGSQFLTSKTSKSIPTSQEDTYLTKALKTPKPTTVTLKQTTLLQTPVANPYKKSTPQPKSLPANFRPINLPSRKHCECYDMKLNIQSDRIKSHYWIRE